MPRQPRSVLPDGIYHVTSRGVSGVAIFGDDEDRRRFLALLGRTVERHAWQCHALCLMSTHYHLVVESRRETLSRGMHRLNGVYAQSFNDRYGRRGHLFADRFSALAITTEEHFFAPCRYLLDNPVRAGMCRDSADWPWGAVRGGAAGLAL